MVIAGHRLQNHRENDSRTRGGTLLLHQEPTMKSAVIRIICRFLIASLTILSIGTASAGMIGVDQLSAAQSDSAAVMNLVTRGEVASQLQARGIDPQLAQQRIASMT